MYFLRVILFSTLLFGQKMNWQSVLETEYKRITDSYQLETAFVIGLVDHGKLVYSTGFGPIAIGSDKIIDKETPIYIASSTKTFTATLLRLLQEEGRLSLTDPLSKRLPEFKPLDQSIHPDQISIRQLLTHTHGIANNIAQWESALLGYDGGNKHLLNLLNKYSSAMDSKDFRYSNLGPVMAGIIYENNTRENWQDGMMRQIFGPLRLKKTSAKISDYNQDEIAQSIYVNSNGQAWSTFKKTNEIMSAAGGIMSTVSDLSHWLAVFMNEGKLAGKQVIPKQVIHDVLFDTVPQNRSYLTYKRYAYSLGWDHAINNGERTLTRFGGFGGTSMHISFIPERKLGVIAFSNADRNPSLPHVMANLLYNLVLEKADWKAHLKEDEQSIKTGIDRMMQNRQETKALAISESQQKQYLGRYKNDSGWPDV
ncbi:MAG: serine hydrolase, partial [Calditrichaeota bacterium]|nr:serine hydrolase [Calditrichota bacterium]